MEERGSCKEKMVAQGEKGDEGGEERRYRYREEGRYSPG